MRQRGKHGSRDGGKAGGDAAASGCADAAPRRAAQFGPDLVLVSAGFDAAAGDPLGGCRVTPACFGHLTALLQPLAPLVLLLEVGRGARAQVAARQGSGLANAGAVAAALLLVARSAGPPAAAWACGAQCSRAWLKAVPGPGTSSRAHQPCLGPSKP